MASSVIKTLVLTIATLVVSLLTYLYFYLGINRPVEITLEDIGPLTLVYKTHVGPYHQIGADIDAVEAWAHEQNLRCIQTFGEFLDNPEGIDEDRLRSHAGCVLNAPPPKVLGADMESEVRARKRYAVGHFQGSPAIGPYKVYPKVRRYLGEHRLVSKAPIIELYTVRGPEMEAQYLFGLEP